MQRNSMITRSRHPVRGNRTPTGQVTALGVALLLAFGLAACGADDDDATTITSDAEGITAVDDEPTADDADGEVAGGDAAEPEDATGDAEANGSADASPTGPQIPAAMPTAIPIPDDHVLLRSEDANYDHSGDFIGVNLVISGTVEERREYYRAALEEAYGEVEVIEAQGVIGEHFRFQGDWFELGEVHVAENEGGLDADPGEWPVLVFISLSEIDDTAD